MRLQIVSDMIKKAMACVALAACAVSASGQVVETNPLCIAAITEGYAVIADDSGIEIDYLGKMPGVYSARYLGEDTPYSYKNQVILDKLKDAKGQERTARYVAAIAVVLADGTEFVLRDTVEGEIAYSPAGEGGFGYDPIFYVPSYGKNMAELTPDEKNAISHRGKALRRMRQCLIDGKCW